MRKGTRSYPSSAFHPKYLQSSLSMVPVTITRMVMGHNTLPYIPSWVNVSYVCSHWRNTALNCPTLWTCHFNLSLCWAEELLLRSKQASLEISCNYSTLTSRKGSWLLSHELRRLNPVVEFLKHSVLEGARCGPNEGTE